MGNLMLTPGPSKYATEGSGLGVSTRKVHFGGRAKFICSFLGFDDGLFAFIFLDKTFDKLNEKKSSREAIK